jgi:hypothetical protein
MGEEEDLPNVLMRDINGCRFAQAQEKRSREHAVSIRVLRYAST